MPKVLWSVGSLLVMLGLAALVFGWDTLLWLPMAAINMAKSNPETYGIIGAGAVLMALARFLSRRE
ncbi:hypothetical protein ACLF3G_28015 [Falsiroseomonas sp. HC035]|uniref:hypothetical protein n=1 Tax=Falsiroseomonas sp. HC035 TaxID=3390999 RepID=UPI003D31158C